MMQRPQQSATRHGHRSAFTMVEILVVIGIIALLVSVLVIALGPTLENARISATRATLLQVNDIIQQRVEAVLTADVSVEAKKLSVLNSGMTQKEAEFIIRKILYRQAVPQRPEDIFGLDQANDSGGDDDAPYAGDWTGSTSTDDDKTTSSELLLFALTNGSQLRVLPGGRTYNVPTLTLDHINSSHIADTDADGLNELVDEWDNPLQFYNFPTRLIRDGGGTSSIDITNASALIVGLPTDTSNTGPLGTDPLDSTGQLVGEFETAMASGTFSVDFEPSGTPISAPGFHEDNYHTLNTYYVPLLMSAGPDQELGFGLGASSTAVERLAQVSASSVDAIFDNITNRQ